MRSNESSRLPNGALSATDLLDVSLVLDDIVDLGHEVLAESAQRLRFDGGFGRSNSDKCNNSDQGQEFHFLKSIIFNYESSM